MPDRGIHIAAEGVREVLRVGRRWISGLGGAGGGDDHGGPHGDHGVCGGAHHASPMTTPTPAELRCT